MNAQLMRTIDKWLGIPACFAMSAGYRVLTSSPQPFQQPKKILFIELSEMGSIVLTYPAMAYIKRTYPDAERFFLTFAQNRSTIDALSIIPTDNVLTLNPTSLPSFVRSTLSTITTINQAGIDTVVDFERFSRFSALLSALTKAKTRTGFHRGQGEGLYRGDCMSHPVLYNAHQPMANNFLALAMAIAQSTERPLLKQVIAEPLSVPLHASSDAAMDKLKARLTTIAPHTTLTRPIILLHPSDGGALPLRAWPIAHYIALATMILTRLDATLILIGQHDARKNAAALATHLHSERCIDFTGQTSFAELLDLYNLADVLITADSGPAHFAALTDINNIVLFGPETPVLYSPLGDKSVCLHAGLSCSPCFSVYNHCQSACQNAQCMRAISAQDVFHTLMDVL